MVEQIFVNLPVKNLNASINFFKKLGFKFNNKFTDSNGACLILGKNMFAMLLVEKFFKTFIKDKKISDAKKTTEVLLALQVKNKEEVDQLSEKAIDAGGREIGKYDHGFMYGRDFEDLDGHIWEIFYMNEKEYDKQKK